MCKESACVSFIPNMRVNKRYVEFLRLPAVFCLSAILLLSIFSACSKNPLGEETIDNGKARRENPIKRKVFIIYSAGRNNLQSNLDANLSDVFSGELPRKMPSSNVLLVYSRRPISSSYRTATPSYLYRVSLDMNGEVALDTLKTWPEDTSSCSAKTVRSVLSFVKSSFPASNYGMLFSSHGTGWLPAKKSLASASSASLSSIGVDDVSPSDTYDMDIEEFADAIPGKLDYLIMDACLMGGVEVAYALREKCHYLISAQTETMADPGLCDYTKLVSRLFNSDEPDLNAVCRDSYDCYAAKSGLNKSLTISLVDCSKMEELASVCKGIFDNFRVRIATVDPATVQAYYHTYFTSSARNHYYYDFEDILMKSGVGESDMSAVRAALDDCVLYKAATPYFLDRRINVHSGLSMYLPSDGTSDLNEFYKTLSWNKCTKLIE